MSTEFNDRPTNYKQPGNSLLKGLIKVIFEKILDVSDIDIDVEDSINASSPAQKTFVLAPPSFTKLVTIIFRPDYFVGESYAKGHWYLKKGDLMAFLKYLLTRSSKSYQLYISFISKIFGALTHLKQKVFIKYFTRKVVNHYDVDHSLYSLFLDEELIYTCAFYENSDDSLEKAQTNKLKTIVGRIELPKRNAKVLDIGCGWGGFARHLVSKKPDLEVVGLSISKNQIEWATNATNKKLEHEQSSRIKFLHQDYTDHCPLNKNYYDVVTVLGMIEHVGLGQYSEFLSMIHKTLVVGGCAFIHTIISPFSNKPSNSWIDKHIFPGGYIPSIPELLKSIEKTPLSVEKIYLHDGINYWKTLQDWRSNFIQSWAKLKSTKQPQFESQDVQERFFRTWYFYFSSVQNLFDNDFKEYKIAHLVLSKKI